MVRVQRRSRRAMVAEQISSWLERSSQPTKTCRYLTKWSLSQSLEFSPRCAERGLNRRICVLRGRSASPQEPRHEECGQGHLVDMVSIRERPAEVEDRAVPGHWEGDLYQSERRAHRRSRRAQWLWPNFGDGRDQAAAA